MKITEQTTARLYCTFLLFLCDLDLKQVETAAGSVKEKWLLAIGKLPPGLKKCFLLSQARAEALLCSLLIFVVKEITCTFLTSILGYRLLALRP